MAGKHRQIICLSSIIFYLMFFVSVAPAPCSTIQLPRTGQDRCYNLDGAEITCSGTGQDGEYRAGVEWPDPRFTVTHCLANGPCPDPSIDCDGDASNDIVTDNLTGLIWARNGNPAGDILWEAAIDFSRDITACGHTDWRLPNIVEIESLHDSGANDQSEWLLSQGFTNISGGYYWSSSSDVVTGIGRVASMVSMSLGVVYPGLPSTTARVLSVRGHSAPPAQLWKTGQTVSNGAGDDGEYQEGAAWPSPRFTVTYCDASGPCGNQASDCDGDASNDVVEDGLTGLIWARNANLANGHTSWQDSVNYVENLTLCGYSDWRLSNRKELFSLVDRAHRSGGGLPAEYPFTNFPSDTDPHYWSSTTRGDGGYAVTVPGGGIAWGARQGASSCHLWPVRSAGSPVTQVRLSVTLAGNRAEDSVASSDGKISCPGGCTADYNEGTAVTLTASTGIRSVFEGWTGCDSVSGNTCSVTMDVSRTVTATFAPAPYLAAFIGGNGKGTIAATGLSCRGNACSGYYGKGAAVTITAHPLKGSVLDAWTGCNAVSGDLCTVTMDVSKTVTAIFMTGPHIEVNPRVLHFGRIGVADVSSRTILVRNKGKAHLEISSAVSGADASEFTTASSCDRPLESSGTCAVTVKFAPATQGKKSATLLITSNDPQAPSLPVPLDGTAFGPSISVSPRVLSFGETRLGSSSSRTVKVKNTGMADVVVSSVSVTDPTGQVSAAHDCSTLVKGDSCEILVTYSPSSAGTVTASLAIASNDTDEPLVTISVKGKGR